MIKPKQLRFESFRHQQYVKMLQDELTDRRTDRQTSFHFNFLDELIIIDANRRESDDEDANRVASVIRSC